MTILLALNKGDIVTLLVTDFYSYCNVAYTNVISKVIISKEFISIVIVSFQPFSIGYYCLARWSQITQKYLYKYKMKMRLNCISLIYNWVTEVFSNGIYKHF